MTRRRSISLVVVALVASAMIGAPQPHRPRRRSKQTPPPSSIGIKCAASTLTAVPGPNGGAPPAFQINMGITQGAVYDAVNAIGPKKHQPYLLDRRFGAKASTDAAVATAAYDVLSALVSDATRDSAVPEPRGAPAMHCPPNTQPRSLRSPMAPSRIRASTQGKRQPTPCSRRGRTTDGSVRLRGSLDPGPDTGLHSSIRVGSRSSTQPHGWATSSRSSSRAPRSSARRHRSRSTAPPTRRSSTRSKTLGRATVSTRPEFQTYIAKWWQSAPTRSWNEVARQLITRNDLSAADSARLLAL